MDKFDLAAELRQRVLNYINANPHCNNAKISIHCKISIDHANRTTNKMERAGEIMRYGSGKIITWTALKKETTSAKEMRDAAYHKKKETYKKNTQAERDEFSRLANKSSLAHKVYRHVPDMPIPNQEAQGSGRREFGVQSSFSLV